MTIKEAHKNFLDTISTVYEAGEAESVARIVFEDVFSVFDFSSTAVFEKQQQGRLKKIERRLLKHEPVQYVLGLADFYSLKFEVTPDVLIPRQETEELVYWIIETLKAGKADSRILDVGTGSGCIPITLKKTLPEAVVKGCDISEKALEIAEKNANLNDVNVAFLQLDILDESKWSKVEHFDIIVSNPPYIPLMESALMPERVKRFEPEVALYVENEDSLLFYRKISEFALQHLVPNGLLFFECNEFNAKEVLTLLDQFGFRDCELRKDINGKERMVRGKLRIEN